MNPIFLVALFICFGFVVGWAYLVVQAWKARGSSKGVRKMSRRSWAWVTLMLAVVSGNASAGPLLYSQLHPNADTQRVLLALSSHEPIEEAVQPPLTEVFDSNGRLTRAIQVGESWEASEQLAAGQSHSTIATQDSYLAWFENRSKSTILTITRIETDHSSIRFRIGEGHVVSTLIVFLVPFALLGVTAYLLKSE